MGPTEELRKCEGWRYCGIHYGSLPLLSVESNAGPSATIQWVVHFLMGEYSFPIILMKMFFGGSFSFTSDPAIKGLSEKPYITSLR
jgi:hypothetical protein